MEALNLQKNNKKKYLVPLLDELAGNLGLKPRSSTERRIYRNQNLIICRKGFKQHL
jgi:hypothetical protein